jgi:Transposase DDE domain
MLSLANNFIPDRKFRNRDLRFATQKRRRSRRFALKDFYYDETSDQYICPEGKVLKPNVKRCVNHGNIYRKYVAAEKECRDCPLRPRCLYGVDSKRKHLAVPIGTEGINLLKQMVEKIETEQGRSIYPQRLAIAEPVFANIRINQAIRPVHFEGKSQSKYPVADVLPRP